MISQLYRKEFATVDAYAGTAMVKKTIQENGAVIVTEEGFPIGLLSAEDLAAKRYNLVIDCLSEKPKISLEQELEEAIELMKKANASALPVYDSEKLVGIVYKSDILEHFMESMQRQKTAVQQIVHDLKNPISNINGLHELLGQNIVKDENKALLAYSQQACHHATEILNSILVTERSENNNARKSKIELNSFLRSCLAEIKGNAALKNITLKDHIPPEPYLLLTDRRKLARVMHNLLSNAVKFTEPGGSILVSLAIDDSQYQITVKDSGVGIPLAIQPLIFQKFTDANRLGTSGENSTGLGLSITQELVAQLDGSIEFKSTENQGTAFYLRFGR